MKLVSSERTSGSAVLSPRVLFAGGRSRNQPPSAIDAAAIDARRCSGMAASEPSTNVAMSARRRSSGVLTSRSTIWRSNHSTAPR